MHKEIAVLNDAQMNYLASVVFAVLAMSLLAVAGIYFDEPQATMAALGAACGAWASAYASHVACIAADKDAVRPWQVAAAVAVSTLLGAVGLAVYGAIVLFGKVFV